MIERIFGKPHICKHGFVTFDYPGSRGCCVKGQIEWHESEIERLKGIEVFTVKKLEDAE